MFKIIKRELKTMRQLANSKCLNIVHLIYDCMSNKNIYIF